MAKRSIRSIPADSEADGHEELLDAVQALTDEVRVLRHAVDELREEIQYAVRNLIDMPEVMQHARPLTSMPIDPAAPDFAERVNRLTPADLPPEEPAAASHPDPLPPQAPPGKLLTEPGDQTRLF
jgi:hypothetical protein